VKGAKVKAKLRGTRVTATITLPASVKSTDKVTLTLKLRAAGGRHRTLERSVTAGCA
jgi:hypothetical protein